MQRVEMVVYADFDDHTAESQTKTMASIVRSWYKMATLAQDQTRFEVESDITDVTTE
jgi:hypothetical protein